MCNKDVCSRLRMQSDWVSFKNKKKMHPQIHILNIGGNENISDYYSKLSFRICSTTIYEIYILKLLPQNERKDMCWKIIYYTNIYIYIYIYIYIQFTHTHTHTHTHIYIYIYHQIVLVICSSSSFSRYPSLSILASSLDCIQCLYWAVTNPTARLSLFRT